MNLFNKIEYSIRKKELLANIKMECEKYNLIMLSTISSESFSASEYFSFSLGLNHVAYSVTLKYCFWRKGHSWQATIQGNGFSYGIHENVGVTACEVADSIHYYVSLLSVGSISFTDVFSLVERTPTGLSQIGVGLHQEANGARNSLYVYNDDMKRLGLTQKPLSYLRSYSQMECYKINNKYVTDEEYERRAIVKPIGNNRNLATQVVLAVYEEERRLRYLCD